MTNALAYYTMVIFILERGFMVLVFGNSFLYFSSFSAAF
jgi:hypothetical protein